ncbi:uncharacterized protein BXZ73DRAFT_50533 [Epithele typhae]|uniref:uncharacterized protein n=1 Tax=Epithele typhae TaxID=378194 RepID=UPI0020088B83|nr:uncharacterized protein BXZ73DRAFT_50533 [Epithele typhae]KAH9924333.1 hypothetical protein BXZ73DRAFT_50533 [Epithele typhae]
MVDQAEDTDEPPPPPPPPPRGARAPGRAPPRAPPAAPAGPEARSLSIDFGGDADLSLSGQWSEDSTSYPPAPPASAVPPQTPPAPATQARAPPPADLQLSTEELMATWGRVGVQMHEVSAALFEKSKKGLVGDGTYIGFVAAVRAQVPTAAQAGAGLDGLGYLVYAQVAGAVQKRASDILPGDVIVVSDAKFKGHKGLQTYNQTVGVSEPVVGVIGDFEAKKSKVKVYQANHIGTKRPSGLIIGFTDVESVSYRLEDLKSGTVKVSFALSQGV